MGNLTVSVIIPTYKAAGYLPKLLEVLNAQTLKPFEIIVIDSSSPDQTVVLARELGCQVKVIPKPEFNHGGTRNLGARLAKGDILVFMTQDALPVGSSFLESLISAILQDQAVAAYARQLPYPDASPPEAFRRQFNYPACSELKTLGQLPQRGFKTFFYSDVSSAVRQEAFWQMGGYPDWVIVDEDVYLCACLLRAGHKVAYQADAQVFHSHNYGLAQQFRRLFDVGVFVSQGGEMLSGAKTGGEGLRMVREMTVFLAQQKAWSWIFYGWLEAIAKFVAFNLGKHHQLLPGWLKPHLSMHKGFWQNAER